jgi:hypothetical protein
LTYAFASYNFRENRDEKARSGIYTDLNKSWFADVGKIISIAMVYLCVWPIIDFFMYFALRHCKRLVD